MGPSKPRVTSDANRLVIGAKGTLTGDWEYATGASYAVNKVKDRYVNGYFKFNELLAAVRAGVQLVTDPSHWEKTTHGLADPSAYELVDEPA